MPHKNMSNVKGQWSNVNPGFTRIELAVVVGIYILLFVFVVIARQTTRAESRDVQRLSDARQMSSIIENQYIDTPNEMLFGCSSLYALVNTCTGPGKISQLKDLKDPSAGSSNPCKGISSGFASQGVCGYSISNMEGNGSASTDSYQICFFIERGGKIQGFSKGLYRIETGGILKQGCN